MIKRFILLISLMLSTMMLFAQTAKPYPATDLKITWEMIENSHQGEFQNLCKLTFTNAGKQTLPASGWKVYFNFGRTIYPENVQGDVTIKWVNGELYEMAPTENFKPLAPKQSFTAQYVSSGALVNYTDAPLGAYMLWEANSTYANMSEVNIIPSTQEKQIKRSAKDKLGIITPEIIFNQNKVIADIDANTLCPILPTPQMYKKGAGNFSITSATSIANTANCATEANYLANKLTGMFGTNVTVGTAKTDNAINFIKKQLVKAEAYELSVTANGIEIRANDGAGFFYGVQSLLQLMPGNVFAAKQSSVNIPVVEVADAPRFGFRAIHFDVSRNFQSKAEVLKVLDVMALYKINTFHFHFSDDDGWRIEMPSLPELTQVGARRGAGSELEMLLPSYGSGADVNNTTGTGHYSTNDFIDILKYATERHIEVIPEIETPGHARAAIKSMEARYHKFIKAGNKAEAERYRLAHPDDKSEYRSIQSWSDNVMDVSMPSVYTFIERVVDDFIEIYKKAGAPLNTIHMGGDEVPVGAWEKSPAFAQLQKGNAAINNTGDLWYYYFDKVNKILKDRNLFVSGWEEAGVRFTERDGVKLMIPNPDFSNQHFQVDVWNNVLGWGAEDLAYKLANSGYKVVLSCVSNNYFDMAYYKSFEEPGYYWGSYTDIDRPFAFIPYDYYKNSMVDLNGNPIAEDAFKGKERLTEYGKTNIVGVKGLLWSETLLTPQAAEYMLLPKLIASAERGWSVDPSWATEPDRTKSEQMYTLALHRFINTVGKFHLDRLNSYSGGYNYRIPTPGVIVTDGKAQVNMQLPGFTLRYTTDGKEPTVKSKLYTQAIDFGKGTFKVKAFSNNGRGSRTVTVSK